MKYNDTIQAKQYNRNAGAYLNAFVNGNLESIKVGTTGILALNTARNVLPKIRLPIVVNADDDRNTTGQTVVFMDVSGLSGEDVDAARILGILTCGWESGEHRLTNIRKLGAYAYARWIGNTVSSRMGLMDYEAISKMNVLLAMSFYACGRPVDQVLAAPNTLPAIAESTFASLSVVTTTIDAFVDWQSPPGEVTLHPDFKFLRVANYLGTMSPVFAQKVNDTTIAKSVAGGWFGEAGMFYSQLALEYPPAFFMGIYMAYMSKTGYKRTQFGTLVQKTLFAGKNSGKGDILVRQINDVIGALTVKQ